MTTKSLAAYRSDDREVLIGLYKNLLWNRMVPHVPAWIPPNVITVVGQLSMVLAVVAAAAAVAGRPSFYLVSAFLMFTYLTCDNIDGPHARRTGRASPLGEFLDHGLDAIASGSILLTGALVLHVDGVYLAALMAIGVVGFSCAMWEQYRTGTLVIPAMSVAEGITLIAAMELAAFLLHDPTWLHFSPEGFNLSTGVFLLVLGCYVAAIAPPLVRSKRAGVRLAELLPVFFVALATIAYALAGAPGALVGILVTLYGADVSCRLILLRHDHIGGAIMRPWHFMLLGPLVASSFGLWTPTGWTAVALGIAVVGYARTLFTGITVITYGRVMSWRELVLRDV